MACKNYMGADKDDKQYESLESTQWTQRKKEKKKRKKPISWFWKLHYYLPKEA